MSKKALIPICLLAALAVGGDAGAYPENYLSKKLGASITTQAKLDGKSGPNALLSDGPISRGGFVFAMVEQPQVFTVDLGQERIFDRVDFGSGNHGSPRCAKIVKISVSDKSADGPYRQVFEQSDLVRLQVLRLPEVKARWVRFDLGSSSEGAHVWGVRIYRGYKHPKLVEVTKLLHEQIKPDLPGLESFYAAAQKGDWKKACSALRAYCVAKYPEEKPAPGTKPDLTLQAAQDIYDGKLEYAGFVVMDKLPIDWAYMKTTDWYEHTNFKNRGRALGVPVDAYWYTNDKKWLKLLKDVFYDWIDANPKPTIMSGADYPTWRTLDSGARSGWLTSRFGKLTAMKDVDDEMWANWLWSIWEHADYLKNDDFDGGNWMANVTGAVMGIATDFPMFKDQKKWLEFGKQSWELNVLRDIHPDGKEMEDAPGYICFAYNPMLGTMQTLDELNIKFDEEARRRMAKVPDFLAAVTQPDGNMPAIGDWGGGPAYVLPKATEYFKRDDIKYILTQGKEGTVPSFTSVNFPHGGWSVMRSAYDEQPYENARHLVFKSSRAAHGHDDALMITTYAYGRELLIDPGIRSYEHADIVRYLSTPYHNTICIDGGNQGGSHGKTEKWVSNDGFDYVQGVYSDWKGPSHRRSVVFVKPDYWIVHDEVTGKGEHTCDQNWHFAEDASIAGDTSTGVMRTGYATGGNLLIAAADPQSLVSAPFDFFIANARMHAGGDGHIPSKGWKYSKSGALPQVFDTVLYPYNGSQAPNVTVQRLEVEGSPADVTALKVTIDDSTDYVLISRGGVKVMSAPSEKLEVEGEIVVVRVKGGSAKVSGENVKSVILAGKTL